VQHDDLFALLFDGRLGEEFLDLRLLRRRRALLRLLAAVRDVDEDGVLGDQVVHGVAKLDVGGAVARQLLHQAAVLAGGRGRAADYLQVVVVAAFQLVGLDRDVVYGRWHSIFEGDYGLWRDVCE
jgi:hypothetical protein